MQEKNPTNTNVLNYLSPCLLELPVPMKLHVINLLFRYYL